MKVRFWSDNGMCGWGREEIIEFDEELSDEELEEEAREWFLNRNEYGFEKLDD